MRVAITGATGNVGTALLRRLAGHDLVGVSRRRPPDDEPYSRMRWVEADVADPLALPGLLDAFSGVDAVVHCAWLIQPSRDRETMRRANQDGTAAVLAAASLADVPHLVHMSSLGAYAPGHGRTVDESWPVTGVRSSPYSVDKSTVEQMLTPYESTMTITRMRPSLILQEDAASEIHRYFLGRIPIGFLQPGAMKVAPWPSSLATQFVHADDVASAVELALEQRVDGALNVAADPVIDRAKFAELFGGVGPAVPPRLLRAVATTTWHAHLQPTDPGWLDLAIESPLLDTSRLRGLGWQPQHDGGQALVSFVQAMFADAGAQGPLLYPA